jgi:hypothetical protein
MSTLTIFSRFLFIDLSSAFRVLSLSLRFVSRLLFHRIYPYGNARTVRKQQ